MILDKDLQSKVKNVLENDGVICFVTDTVWGIGCLPESKIAVKKIYQIKNREQEKPLILMSDDIYPLFYYIKNIPKVGQKLIKRHFPGALTVVVEKSENTPDYITSGFDTVGIRVPDNELFAEICRCIKGRVLATTSANLSHEPAALTFDEANKFIGDKVDLLIYDYGYSAKGIASTVVGFNSNDLKIYRQGAIEIKENQNL